MPEPKNWKRLALEGVVVVGSILLAFGIDAWWEGRQERAFEQEALGHLEVEFAENRDRLGRGVVFTLAARGAALHEMLQSMPAEAESVSVSDTLLAALLGTGTFDRVTPVLDGLLRSGRFEMIRDPQVREAVATWERWLVQLAEREMFAATFVDTRLRPALVTHGDVSRVFARTSVLTGSDEVTVLRIDNELKALVAEKHARDQNNIRRRARVRASIEDVLSAISRAKHTPPNSP